MRPCAKWEGRPLLGSMNVDPIALSTWNSPSARTIAVYPVNPVSAVAWIGNPPSTADTVRVRRSTSPR